MPRLPEAKATHDASLQDLHFGYAATNKIKANTQGQSAAYSYSYPDAAAATPTTLSHL